jgi:hypothetical protein
MILPIVYSMIYYYIQLYKLVNENKKNIGMLRLFGPRMALSFDRSESNQSLVMVLMPVTLTPLNDHLRVSTYQS